MVVATIAITLKVYVKSIFGVPEYVFRVMAGEIADALNRGLNLIEWSSWKVLMNCQVFFLHKSPNVNVIRFRVSAT